MGTYYSERATQAKFPLGGIGTGNVSLSSRGSLEDWEIFNHPNKGLKLPYSFFSIWVKEGQKKPLCRILESEIQPPYSSPTGLFPSHCAGLPRLRHSSMKVAYPFADIEFTDNVLPCRISLEAYSPFIPLNEDDSGIPGFYITYTVENTSTIPIDVSIAGTISNGTGFIGENIFGNYMVSHHGHNTLMDTDELIGINYLPSEELDPCELTYGSLSLAMEKIGKSYSKHEWHKGGWTDGLREFWDDFSRDGILQTVQQISAKDSFMQDEAIKAGSIGSIIHIHPNEKQKFRFLISWNFPNHPNGWGVNMFHFKQHKFEKALPVRRNYYALKFKDSWSAISYLIKNRNYLSELTHLFTRTLYESTIPEEFIEAAAANITVIRSTTCFRLEDGTFYGFEGSHQRYGSCEGSCTHVWNYAQTLAFLFPQLEQSMREVEFIYEIDENGCMNYRAMHVFNEEAYNIPPAADGQLGSILRVYREWKLSGNAAFLKKVWGNVKKALDYAISKWDPKRSGILQGMQHNTYDIEFYGNTMMLTSIYLSSLSGAAEIALYLNEKDYAHEMIEIRNAGMKYADKKLWNGEYYNQALDNIDEYLYQVGDGCLSDQLLGQTWSHLYGLQRIIPNEKAKKALHSIMKYNFKHEMRTHESVQRIYALNDEEGLVLCSWPKGNRPKIPFIYSDEVWTGIEYQVASHMIYEGMLDEAKLLVTSLRSRFDGYKRNPWNENECGNHYVRSLSSWGLIIASSGFKFNLPNKQISFNPVTDKDDYSCFWSCGKAWGRFTQKKDKETGEITKKIDVYYGDLEDIALI